MENARQIKSGKGQKLKVKQPILGVEYLRQQTRWIRDVLDPKVAKDGPDTLHSDEVLTLDELLRTLADSHISQNVLLHSRIHLAICDIAGNATRWPLKLIDRADSIKHLWEEKYGNLLKLSIPLYELGGRLNGICEPQDNSEDELLFKWLRMPEEKMGTAVANRTGDLGFKPGDWWIGVLFAHRDGIIDCNRSASGLISDAHGAYALVMTGWDEFSSRDPNNFQYRARDKDLGRYRLTAGTPESRRPVRILRSHSLHSPWKPRVGLRYDGLHQVTGWSVMKDNKSDEIVFIVDFERLPKQTSMETVLCRPWSDEVEDYKEYKRLRRQYRTQQLQKAKQMEPHQDFEAPLAPSQGLTISEDNIV